MADLARHWNFVHSSKAAHEFSWFQRKPITSLRLIQQWAPPHALVLDVGSGTSSLVEHLLDAGMRLDILDISSEALRTVRERLGDRSHAVHFIGNDVCLWHPEHTDDVWHDRAVFHFLVEPDDRQRYIATASSTVKPGGILIVAAFAADGPLACSGLPTARYSSDELAMAFASNFVLEHAEREVHFTPQGIAQPFTWVVLRRLNGQR